jgi:hypothetical protein
MTNTYKIVLVGNSRVGKTTLIRKMKDLESTIKYQSTLGVEVHPFQHSSRTFYNLWDTGSIPIFWIEGGIGQQYLSNADMVIIVKGGEGFSVEDWDEFCGPTQSRVVDKYPNVKDIEDIINVSFD